MFASLHVAFVAGFDNVVSSASNTHLVKKLKYGPLTPRAGRVCGAVAPNTPPKVSVKRMLSRS